MRSYIVKCMLRASGSGTAASRRVWALQSAHRSLRADRSVHSVQAVFLPARRFSNVSIVLSEHHTALNANDNNCSESPSSVRSLEATAAPQGHMCIVFTDIVKSTALWEYDPKAMAAALQKHDDIVRSLVRAHEGYEVKQNGDGFMIAFTDTVTALKFCLNVQQELLKQRWSDHILEHRPARVMKDDDGTILFKGLRLRMSAHTGEPVCVWNEVINRMDYLGPMVNRAARFIQVAEGGQIVVSEEFLLEIQGAMESSSPEIVEKNSLDHSLPDIEKIGSRHLQKKAIDQEFELRILGEYHLKGLAEEQKLYFIVPESLRGRLDLFPRNQYVAGSKGNILPEVT